MVSTNSQNDHKNESFPSDGRSNSFEKLPKRSQKWTIPQRWALKMVSKSYQNDHKNESFPSDGRSKWFQTVTKTITQMNHSPAMGAQNDFEKWPKRAQKWTIPQWWALRPYGTPNGMQILFLCHFHVIPDHPASNTFRWSGMNHIFMSSRITEMRSGLNCGERADRALSLSTLLAAIRPVGKRLVGSALAARWVL